MSRLIAALCAVSLVACGGSSTGPGGSGPLNLAIVAGQNQTVAAGSHQLGAPVVGQLVRKPDGSVAFRWMRTVGDAIVPPAFAQTVVNGSPVPGAVVCAVSVDSVHTLVPFTPCTNTDSSGKATFFFTPGTVAGTAEAEIRGTVNSEPAVFDTAMATVTPGPADTVALSTHSLALFVGESYPLDSIVSHVADAYGNVISGAALETTAGAGLAVASGAFSPTAEAVATLTVGSGAVHDTVAVAGLYDLRASGWTATYACSAPVYSGNPDSIIVTLQSDSVVYGVTPPMRDALNGTAWLYFAGTQTAWKSGTSTTTAITRAEWLIEYADHLEYGGGNGTATASGTPRTYTGGNWCDPRVYQSSRAATMTATS